MVDHEKKIKFLKMHKIVKTKIHFVHVETNHVVYGILIHNLLGIFQKLKGVARFFHFSINKY
jgi:hypothetical protein